MKNNLIIIVLVLLMLTVFAVPTFAEVTNDKQNSLTIDPLWCSLEIYGLDYERSVNEKSAIHLAYNSFGYKDSNEDTTAEISGSMTVLGGKLYFKKAQHGGYIGADIRFINLELNGRNSLTKLFAEGNNTSYAVMLGRKNFLGYSGITYDMGLTYLITPDAETEGTTGIYLRFGYGW